jgi:cell division control protein 6
LVGPPGTGKTAVSKFVLKQLTEYSNRPLPLYINCWQYQSRFAVFSLLSTALGEPMPRRGIAADEVFSRVIEIAKKDGRTPIIILDEADRLETHEEGIQVLYDLCRASEMHSLKTGIIAITNDEEFHIRLDSRIRSSFVQHTLKFSPYTVPQMKEILSRRAKLAFFEGALGEDVIPLCAAISFKAGGDARIALALLLSSGKAAERENAATVDVRHVRQIEATAVQKTASKAERKLPELDEMDAKIVETIRKAGEKGIESGKLYQLLGRAAKARSLRRRIDLLEKSGIISAETLQLAVGRTRIIKIKG